MTERISSALTRALDHAFARPRAIQLIAAVACALLLWQSFAAPAREPATTAWQPTAAAQTPAAQAGPDTPERAVERYNHASAEAARLGRADILAAHLDPLGPAWRDAQAEFARRLASGERRDPTLRRWGVLGAEHDGAAATVVTQELWDDVVRVDGVVTASARGVLTRNTYSLRRAGAGWLIVDIETETLVR